MKRNKVLGIILTVTLITSLLPVNIYAADGDNINIAATAVTTFSDLQEQIENANEGDTIYIASGTIGFTEAILISKSITISGISSNDTILKVTQDAVNRAGGFRHFVALDDAQNVTFKNMTIQGPATLDENDNLTGGADDSPNGGIEMSNVSNGITKLNLTNMVLEYNINNASDKDGEFEISNSNGDGGAICINGSNNMSEVNITGSKILYNKSSNGNGGGVNVYSNTCSAVSLVNCSIKGNNTKNEGGGMAVNSATGNNSASLTDCTINDNSTSLYGGGGMAISNNSGTDKNSTITLTGCSIKKNNAAGSGGGLMIGGDLLGSRNCHSATVLTNCTFEDNASLDRWGGGIHINGGESKLDMKDCTIKNNSALQSGGGLIFGSTFSSSEASLDNCVVNSNTGGGIAVSGNLSCDTTLTNSVVSNNKSSKGAHSDGGGVIVSSHYDSIATLTNCDISGNAGYGVNVSCSFGDNSNSMVNLNKCAINNNSGQAVDVYGEYSSTANLNNCTLNGNNGYYGAVNVGSGVNSSGSSIANLTNCTVANTRAEGINIESGDNRTVNLTNCTVTANKRAICLGYEGVRDCQLRGCIIAGNLNNDIIGYDMSSLLITPSAANGYNIIEWVPAEGITARSVFGKDTPTLAVNNALSETGMGKTIMLATSSPALNLIPIETYEDWTKSTSCAGIDQRGFPRPASSIDLVDLGAVEVQLFDDTPYFTDEPISSIVNFIAPGAKLSAMSKKVIFNEPYGDLSTVVKTGYTFMGWYDKEQNGTKVLANTIVREVSDHNLYAYWNANKYTINFNANASKVTNIPGPKTVTFDSNIGKLPKPKKKGYRFLGWYIGRKSTDIEIKDNSIMRYDKDIAAYAHWQANTYKVTFNANGKKVKKLKPKSKNVKYGSQYGKLPKPKRVGYKFVGWYTKKKGGTKITASKKMIYAKKIKLYAHWAKIK